MAEKSEISQPSLLEDPLHIANLVSAKLKRENYFLWKSELVPLLKSHDIFNLVQGKDQCPPKYLSADKKVRNTAYRYWKKKDRSCRIFIAATLSDDMLKLISSCSRSATAVWLGLEQEFSAITRPRIQHLKTRLMDLNKGKLTVLKYIELAEEIADGLEILGSPIDDWDFAAHVVRGLPRDYDACAKMITNQLDPPATREELRTYLLSEEIVVYNRRQEEARKLPNAASNSEQPKPPAPLSKVSSNFTRARLYFTIPEFTLPWFTAPRLSFTVPELTLPRFTAHRFIKEADYGVIVANGCTVLASSALISAFIPPLIAGLKSGQD